MIDIITGISTQLGIQFGPNGTGKKYLSYNEHRGNGDPRFKSKWHPDITPLTEYQIFCNADHGNWYCSQGHYWGVDIDNNNKPKTLGCRREILCKFPHNANPSIPWHGFPVSPENGDNDTPPSDFIENWINNGVVSRTLGRKIQRRKV
jgi:hypothetical protein